MIISLETAKAIIDLFPRESVTYNCTGPKDLVWLLNHDDVKSPEDVARILIDCDEARTERLLSSLDDDCGLEENQEESRAIGKAVKALYGRIVALVKAGKAA
jgi:hypothetical protein